MKNKISRSQKGFTLLEILLVVGIISLLAGIVIVAINPSKQLATVRNTERKSDIKQLNSAILQFYIDHGYFPASTTPITGLTEVCATGNATTPTAECDETMVDLYELVPMYITSIPTDPSATTTGTGYEIIKNAGKLGVNAALAELQQFIALGVESGGEVTPPEVTYDWDNLPDLTSTTLVGGSDLAYGTFAMWGGGTGTYDYIGEQTYSLYYGGSVTGYTWSYDPQSWMGNYFVLVNSSNLNEVYIGATGWGAFLFKDNLTWGGNFTGNRTDGLNGSGTTESNAASFSWGVAPTGWGNTPPPAYVFSVSTCNALQISNAGYAGANGTYTLNPSYQAGASDYIGTYIKDGTYYIYRHRSFGGSWVLTDMITEDFYVNDSGTSPLSSDSTWNNTGEVADRSPMPTIICSSHD